MKQYQSLLKRMNVKWNDESLLTQALTHSSFAGAATKAPDGSLLKRPANYDRLEFLGDRVLGVVIAELLFRNFPDAPEGELSRRLASLVRRETCSKVALCLELSTYMLVGANARPSQTRNNENVLADVMEALLGAIYLDQGFAAVRKVIENLWGEFIDSPPQALHDAKSALQEWAQKRGLPAPLYEIIAQKGPDHKPHFVVRVVVEGLSEFIGEGNNKRMAEHAAAQIALEQSAKIESN